MTAPPIESPVESAQSTKQMHEPLWRIRNIYTIRSKSGQPIPFRPNPEQEEILRCIYVLGQLYLIIPKARQLGFSTLLAIIILDSMMFGSGLQCSIVDATAQDAKKKLDEKIKYAWEALPAKLRARYEEPTDNKDEWRIKLKSVDGDESKASESWVFAGERARGGTNQILWISEWGTIGLTDKARSTEILTGALPTAKHPGCLVVVETTWKGGRQGDLWPIVAEARRQPENLKGPKDARVKFFAWWTNPEYQDGGDASQITPRTHEYFEKLSVTTGRQFSPAQRLWWQKTSVEQGMFMGREYPSTIEECFEAPTEGAFFDKDGLDFIYATCITTGKFVRHCDIMFNGYAAQWVPREQNVAPFRIWEDPVVGAAYILSADFCVGKQAAGSSGKRDANSWSVWRAERTDPTTRVRFPAMKVAACCLEDRSGTPESVRRIKVLARFYGDCMVIPEINNKDNICGQLMADTPGTQDGVKNMWSQRTGEFGAMPGQGQTEEVLGWLTTGTRDGGGTRRQMLMTLQEAIRERKLIIPDERFYHEAMTFIVNEKGKAEAAPGCFDDSILEGAIGVHNLVAATVCLPMNPMQSAQQAGRANFHLFDQSGSGL